MEHKRAQVARRGGALAHHVGAQHHHGQDRHVGEPRVGRVPVPLHARLAQAELDNLFDLPVVPAHLGHVADKRLAGADVAEPLLANLGQRAGVLGDGPVDVFGEAAKEKGAEHDGGRGEKQHGRQRRAEVHHHSEPPHPEDGRPDAVVGVLHDRLGHHQAVGVEPREQVADPVGVEELGVLAERVAVQLAAQARDNALARDAEQVDAEDVCGSTERHGDKEGGAKLRHGHAVELELVVGALALRGHVDDAAKELGDGHEDGRAQSRQHDGERHDAQLGPRQPNDAIDVAEARLRLGFGALFGELGREVNLGGLGRARAALELGCE
jgi:hypothetical protein